MVIGMKKARWIGLLMICCLLVSIAARGLAAEMPQTGEWTPPDLSALDASAPVELLILKVAQEELGYVEGPRDNESKYGDWFSGGRVSWCAEFLTWCVNEVDSRYGTALLYNEYPFYGLPEDGAPFFIQRGRFVSYTGAIPKTRQKQFLVGSHTYLKSGEYIPSPGDYMWFAYYSKKIGTDHVAIVEGVSRNEKGETVVHVIEGNNPDSVQRATYLLTDKRIYGYGTPVPRAYTVVRVYHRGQEVAQIAQYLEQLGYYEAEKKQTGIFTRNLQTAAKDFQRDNGIKPTGEINIETRYKLIEKAEGAAN